MMRFSSSETAFPSDDSEEAKRRRRAEVKRSLGILYALAAGEKPPKDGV